MSLQVWLPMTKDLRQQGLSNRNITNTGATFSSNGKLGGCYVFDGTDDAIGIGDLSTLVGTNFSFTCWFYHSDTWGTKSYETILGGPSGFELEAKSGSTNSPVIKAYSWGGGSFTYELNKWNHLVMTRTSSETKFYLNGELKLTGTTGSIPSGDYFVGAWKTSTGQNYKGNMCDVRIYDHCLSPMEVKRISQGLVLHYPLNNMGFGQENFILESHKVISGGQASGITRTYENDGSMKIVASSGNGTWCSLGFAKNSNTNVGNNMTVGDTYCISCDVKVESGTVLPTLFINNGNSYKQLKPVNGSIITNKWMRIYYSSTWADPGTSSYGNISLHLGFNSAIGTYYFKNFKLEKGSIPTPWSPAPSDDLATQMGLNSNIEYDTSGYCNNGTVTGTPIYTSDTPKYAVSTQFTGTQYILSESPTTNGTTLAAWVKTTSTSNQALIIDYKSGLGIGFWSSYIIPSCNSAIKTTYPNSAYHVNEWNHIVIVKNSSSSILCYVNGELQNAGSAQDYWSTNVIDGFSIAARPNGASPSTCQISDVRIYATALSATDVKSLYQNTATIDADGTIHGAVR